MNREDVQRLVMDATTPEECRVAEATLDQWMREHPADWGMLDLGEQLALIQEDSGAKEVSHDAVAGDEAGAPPDGNGRRPAARYALSFEEEVAFAREEFGWDE